MLSSLRRVRRSALFMRRHWPRYAAVFGWSAGWSIVRALLHGRRSAEPTLLPVPGLRAPIALRVDRADVKVFDQVFVDREYDFSVGFDPTFIVDGGANIGLTAVWYAQRYPKATIVSVEPEPGNVALLRRNTAAYPQVQVRPAALWPTPGFVQISNPLAGPWAFRVESAAGGIPAVTLPDLLADAPPDAASLVKIDIEGAELELFAADCAWLTRVRALVVETHDQFRPGSDAAVRAAAQRAGLRELPHPAMRVFVRA